MAIRNWKAFQKLGIAAVYAPGSYHTYFQLNEEVDIGTYHSPSSPDQPTVIRMLRTPCKPGLTQIEQNKAGCAELLATSFATFEHNIRDQLARSLGNGGFDAVHDIEAITVNRWPHGYAPEYNPLYDPELLSRNGPKRDRARAIRADFRRQLRLGSGGLYQLSNRSGGARHPRAAVELSTNAVSILRRTASAT